MNKDKRTEIANDLNRHCCSLAEQFCGEMSCNSCITDYLYNAGYRKACDVAREIFEEIEEMLNMQATIVCQTRDSYSTSDIPSLSFIAMLDGRIYSIRVVEEHLAELKKKYTEDKK